MELLIALVIFIVLRFILRKLNVISKVALNEPESDSYRDWFATQDPEGAMFYFDGTTFKSIPPLPGEKIKNNLK